MTIYITLSNIYQKENQNAVCFINIPGPPLLPPYELKQH